MSISKNKKELLDISNRKESMADIKKYSKLLHYWDDDEDLWLGDQVFSNDDYDWSDWYNDWKYDINRMREEKIDILMGVKKNPTIGDLLNDTTLGRKL